MEIREANKSDLKEIHILTNQLGYDYPIEKINIQLDKILKNQEHQIYVAIESNEIIGYVHVQIYRTLYGDDLLNILGIVVKSEYRNKGVGAKLLKAIEDFAREVNCVGIRANSSISRTDAHIFYINKGYENDRTQKRFIKYIN